MANKTIRAFSTIMATVMAMSSSIVTPVFAAEEGPDVCYINDVGYSSIGSAVKAASDGDTIKLESVIPSEPETVVINKDITMEGAVGSSYIIANDTLFDIKDSTVTLKGSITISSKASDVDIVKVGPKSTLDIQGEVYISSVPHYSASDSSVVVDSFSYDYTAPSTVVASVDKTNGYVYIPKLTNHKFKDPTYMFEENSWGLKRVKSSSGFGKNSIEFQFVTADSTVITDAAEIDKYLNKTCTITGGSSSSAYTYNISFVPVSETQSRYDIMNITQGEKVIWTAKLRGGFSINNQGTVIANSTGTITNISSSGPVVLKNREFSISEAVALEGEGYLQPEVDAYNIYNLDLYLNKANGSKVVVAQPPINPQDFLSIFNVKSEGCTLEVVDNEIIVNVEEEESSSEETSTEETSSEETSSEETSSEETSTEETSEETSSEATSEETSSEETSSEETSEVVSEEESEETSSEETTSAISVDFISNNIEGVTEVLPEGFTLDGVSVTIPTEAPTRNDGLKFAGYSIQFLETAGESYIMQTVNPELVQAGATFEVSPKCISIVCTPVWLNDDNKVLVPVTFTGLDKKVVKEFPIDGFTIPTQEEIEKLLETSLANTRMEMSMLYKLGSENADPDMYNVISNKEAIDFEQTITLEKTIVETIDETSYNFYLTNVVVNIETKSEGAGDEESSSEETSEEVSEEVSEETSEETSEDVSEGTTEETSLAISIDFVHSNLKDVTQNLPEDFEVGEYSVKIPEAVPTRSDNLKFVGYRVQFLEEVDESTDRRSVIPTYVAPGTTLELKDTCKVVMCTPVWENAEGNILVPLTINFNKKSVVIEYPISEISIPTKEELEKAFKESLDDTTVLLHKIYVLSDEKTLDSLSDIKKLSTDVEFSSGLKPELSVTGTIDEVEYTYYLTDLTLSISAKPETSSESTTSVQIGTTEETSTEATTEDATEGTTSAPSNGDGSPESYQISILDKNGSVVKDIWSDSLSFTFNGSYGLTEKNATIYGWISMSDGAFHKDGATVTLNASPYKVMPVWSKGGKVQYYINYDCTDDTASTDQGKIRLTKSVSKSGYNFNGWTLKIYQESGVTTVTTKSTDDLYNIDTSKGNVVYVEATANWKKKSSGGSGAGGGINVIQATTSEGSTESTSETSTESTESTESTTSFVETTTETTTEVPDNIIDTPSYNFFYDIDHRAWAIEAINNMASKGFINGVSNGMFSPDANCKRGDFVVVLCKVLGMSSADTSTSFSDVPANAYYTPYIAAAERNGLITGSNGKFRPNDPITRQDMMCIVYRALEGRSVYMNPDSSYLAMFNDSNSISDYAKAAIAGLVSVNAVQGEGARINPKGYITRAQMAVLMNNFNNILN